MLANAWAVGFVPDVFTTDSCRARMSIRRVTPETLSFSIARKTPSAGPPTAGVWVSVPLLPTSLAVFQDTTRSTCPAAGRGASRATTTGTKSQDGRTRTVGTGRLLGAGR